MAKLENLCVYCGSSDHVDGIYLELAEQLGRAAAAQGIGIVYGAGGVGLMGALANGALAEGGHVVGVIPEHLEQWESASVDFLDHISYVSEQLPDPKQAILGSLTMSLSPADAEWDRRACQILDWDFVAVGPDLGGIMSFSEFENRTTQ